MTASFPVGQDVSPTPPNTDTGSTLADFFQSVLVQLTGASVTSWQTIETQLAGAGGQATAQDNLSKQNYIALAAHSACEGTPNQQGGYNPLNTTLPAGNYGGNVGEVKTLPGNAAYLGGPHANGGNPVRNYATWASGVNATVQTMLNHPLLTQALRQGADPRTYARIIGAIGWGTNPACMLAKIAEFEASPAKLAAWLAQPVNTNGQTGIAGGGAGPGAASGAATPGLGVNFPWTGVVGGLESVLSALVSGAFWRRIGTGALGVALLAAGLWIFLGTTQEGQRSVTGVGS